MARKIAIFSDVHGNLPALEAAFADMGRRELQERYCLGDLVGYGTFPNEVIRLIQEYNVPTIKGNYDQGVSVNSDDCGCAYKTEEDRRHGEQSIRWTNAHTTAENKAYLRSLPSQLRVQLAGLKLLMVRGSPRRINEYLYEDRPDGTLERIVDGVDADVLVCGHTHFPYYRVLPSGRHIVNTGSLGKPKDDNPDACYAQLSAEIRELHVEFIRVPYDVERMARDIEATEEMPNSFAKMLREGHG
jgi:predicted phosphodiesterase